MLFISVINQLDAKKCLFYNEFYFMPLHVSNTCVHHHEVKIALHSLWYHHTYRCDDTRGCVMQFWPPDDEHMCSKYVEAWNKTHCKTNILRIKLVKCWDRYTEMHGQQNVKKKYFFLVGTLVRSFTGANGRIRKKDVIWDK